MTKIHSWSYGVMTVPNRRHDLLPKTLRTLADSGFTNPRLFVDGAKDASDYNHFGLPVTTRDPTIRIAGNYILGLWEMYARDPSSTYFAMFQDDITICRGVREYIERGKFPQVGYLNLCTYAQNQDLADGRTGWYASNQRGRGAQALVFDRQGVMTLLSRQKLIDRMQDAHRGYRAIDGTIINSLKPEGYTEYVHDPSLVDHIGTKSVAGNNPQVHMRSFRGCEYDVLELLSETT